MLSRLIPQLRAFRDDTRGYVSLEAMIILPALLWIFSAGWVYYDALHQQTVNQKANYTISDMISRETDALTADYVDNAQTLLRILTKTDNVEAGIRITVVTFDGTGWQIGWSRSRGAAAPAESLNIADFDGRLPQAAAGEQLILVETWDRHNPALQVGLGAFDIRSYSFTRPRYAPQVVLATGA
jgi:hypothetical protein